MMRDGHDKAWCYEAVGKNAIRFGRTFTWFRVHATQRLARRWGHWSREGCEVLT